MRAALRAFISVDLPRFEPLEALSRELGATGASLKLVNLAQIHLTLKFLGDTEEELVPKVVDAMRDAVRGVSPFDLRVVGTGAFPNLRRMNVLWVGIEGGEPLVVIARRLEAGVGPLGYPPEGRDFSPHVTIARVKGDRNLDAARRVLEGHQGQTFGGARVDRVQLKKSVLGPQGPTYTTIDEVPF